MTEGRQDEALIVVNVDERQWLLALVNEEIARLRGSGRGTSGAKWARELRALRTKIKEAK
jgi:hypothetical protein